MVARKRNYKAEYARKKARATARGYRSPYEERKARKALKLPRDFLSLDKRDLPDWVLDVMSGKAQQDRKQAAKEWSDRHSHVKASRFNPNMSNKQFDAYYRAFIEPHHQLGPSRRKRSIERRKRIHEYMKQYGGVEEGTPEDARYTVGLRT